MACSTVPLQVQGGELFQLKVSPGKPTFVWWALQAELEEQSSGRRDGVSGCPWGAGAVHG